MVIVSVVLLAVFLILLNEYTKSNISAIMFNIFFYAVAFFGFIAIYNIIAAIFGFAAKHGKPIDLIYGLFQGHLTDGQAQKLGKAKALQYEYLIMRMDMIVPIMIVYFFFLWIFFPNMAQSVTVAQQTVVFPIIFLVLLGYTSIFLLYTMLTAYLLSLKADVLFPNNTISEEDIRNFVISTMD